MSDSKVAEDTPCCDSGSFIKWCLNPFYGCKINNPAVDDDAEVVVVGAGRRSGSGANDFVNKHGEHLMYLTYRNCFPKLPNGSTTDSYWGCLVRTGQMVMAQAFMRFYGGGCTVIPDDRVEELRDRAKPLFMDLPSAPLSLHQIEYEAHEQGVKYARWLSPTQACKACHVACLKYREAGNAAPFPICCEDRNINKAEAYAVLRRGEPVLFLIPVVMGIKTLSESYQKVLQRCLDMEHVCGIAGGAGKASVYLFGRQGQTVFYLDPHYVQAAYVSEKTEGKMRCKHGAMRIKKVDPCMFIGFYVHDEADFEKFLIELAEMNSHVAFPLISVSEDDPRKRAAAQLNVRPEDVDNIQADRIVAFDDESGQEDFTTHSGTAAAGNGGEAAPGSHSPAAYPTEGTGDDAEQAAVPNPLLAAAGTDAASGGGQNSHAAEYPT